MIGPLQEERDSQLQLHHLPSGLRRESSGPGREREFRERDFTPSVADEVNQWRSAKPLVDPTRGYVRREGVASASKTWGWVRAEQSKNGGCRVDGERCLDVTRILADQS